jgi:hypothetical protein
LSSEDQLLEYKVVETSIVTDEMLEQIINDWVFQGWRMEDIRFVVKESSRRPVMAFLVFTRARKPN